MTATATKPAKSAPAAADAPIAKGISLAELREIGTNAGELYRQAVITSARTGVAPSPRDLLVIVSAMERSLDQFMRDVETVQRRIAAVESIAAADSRKPEADALHGVYLERRFAFVEMKADFDKRLQAAEDFAYEAKHAANTIAGEIDEQRRRAFDTLSGTADPAIGGEVKAAEREIDRLKALRNDPEQEPRFAVRFSEARRNATGSRDEIELTLNPLRSQIIAELDEEIAAAERRLTETHRERLRPERFKLT